MKIEIDNIVRNKFSKGKRRLRGKNQVDTFVIHGTAGGGTLNWMRNMSTNSFRGKRYKRDIGLFHFIIERDGSITEIIDPTRWTHHATIGRRDAKTIGVELVNPSSTNTISYTKKQYESLIWLYTYLRYRDGYKNMKSMASHARLKSKYGNGWKNCPGRGFSWESFREELSKRFDFKYNPKYQSQWDIDLKIDL